MFLIGRRVASQMPSFEPIINRSHHKMKAWQINSYEDPIQLVETRIPMITDANQVLIEVLATSVNPIDVRMAKGFGSTLVGLLRKQSSGLQFPITFGRDFVGKVVECGQNVKLAKNEKVWGVVPAALPGSHAQYLVLPSKTVIPKPEVLSDVEATSLLYAGVTACSAFHFAGGLSLQDNSGKRVLVLGASGGVGSLAVQLLKASNSMVISTCSADAVPLVSSLGADAVVDYRSPTFDQELLQYEPYDLILDCAGLGSDFYTSSPWKGKQFVTLTSPLLSDTDQNGLVFGLTSSVFQLGCQNVKALSKGSGIVKWGFFTPCRTILEHINKLVLQNKIKPVIDSVYSFSKMLEAYTKIEQGGLRGKIVIDHSSTNENHNESVLR